MFKKLLITTAVSTALAAGTAATPVFAQQQGGGNSGSGQQWMQEQAQGQGTQVYISTAGVRQIQQTLNQQGFDVGQVDGIWGSETSQAARDYQRSRGLEPTGTPTLALIQSLGAGNILSGNQGGNQQGMQWRQENATGSGTPIYVSTAGVRQIQQSLNQRGYDVGQVDGQWGENTVRAVRAFQRANGLEPNGRLDTRLVSALGGSLQALANIGSQGGGQQSMQWRQENAQGSGTQLFVSPAVVRQVQQSLNQQGFDVGRVDGVWADNTVQAVERFQRSRGLEPTGTLTTNTLSALGLNNWMSGNYSGGGQQQGGGQQGGGFQGGGQQGGGFQGGGQQGGGQQGGQQWNQGSANQNQGAQWGSQGGGNNQQNQGGNNRQNQGNNQSS